MGHVNANEYGFLPENNGIENQKALQKAVNETGTIIVSIPGEYKIAGTVYIGSYTTLNFGNGVILQKTDEMGGFSHVFLNKGALTKSYDNHIRIENLCLETNGIDCVDNKIMGLRGQVAFYYIKDLVLEGFRCMDLGASQFAIHICTFEDILIRDIIIMGDKDGIHLGKGKRFYIGNCVFRTFDDAVALNAQDYDNCNPEMGWIEDGVVENCHDLDDDHERKVGFFCRGLSGGWVDWFEGMEVQKSDTVVSGGRLYRVRAAADGKKFKSVTRPMHDSGEKTIDGVRWFTAGDEAIYSVGVRNVIFRNIFLHKPRIGFAFILEVNRWNRSYYKGAGVPIQEKITMENIRVLHKEDRPFVEINSALDYLAIHNSLMENTKLQFYDKTEAADYLETILHIKGCVLNCGDINSFILNEAKHKNKVITMHSDCNVFLSTNNI